MDTVTSIEVLIRCQVEQNEQYLRTQLGQPRLGTTQERNTNDGYGMG